jgi:hypothetical protein
MLGQPRFCTSDTPGTNPAITQDANEIHNSTSEEEMKPLTMQITVTLDEDILSDIVRRAVASVVGSEQNSSEVKERRIPPLISRQHRQFASAAPPSNATIEQLIAYFQANVNKLDSRLDEIRELVVGRSKEHLTVAEVAEMTGRSAYSGRRWISDGRLNASRVSNTGERGRLLVQRDDLKRIISGGLGQDL